MPAYTIGGGGGLAGTTTSTDHALDKPYDLYWPLTADQVQSINEMLDLLFKSATKSATDIKVLNTDPGILKVAVVEITAARFLSLNTSPVTFVAAPGASKIIFPLQWIYEQNILGTAFGTAPTVRIRYDGSTTTIVTNRGISNVANRHEIQHLGSTGYTFVDGVDAEVRNRAIEVDIDADTTGGSGNFRFTLWYYIANTYD